MRLKLNERSQAELLAIMGLMGLSGTNPTYAIQKLISQQYHLLTNDPEREVNNAGQETENVPLPLL